MSIKYNENIDWEEYTNDQDVMDEYWKRKENIEHFFEEVETYTKEQREIVRKTASFLKMIDQMGQVTSFNDMRLTHILMLDISLHGHHLIEMEELLYFVHMTSDRHYLFLMSFSGEEAPIRKDQMPALFLSNNASIIRQGSKQDSIAAYKQMLHKLVPVANIKCIEKCIPRVTTW